MKVIVLMDFEDKYTNRIHRKNEVIEISKERFEEINSTSCGILVAEIQAKKKINKKVGDIDVTH